MAGIAVQSVNTSSNDSDSDTECPICHEDFRIPKILPCGHIACRDCILTWLDRTAQASRSQGQGQGQRNEGGCPLCRAPIPSSPTPSQQGGTRSPSPTQLGPLHMVDSWPTDMVIMRLIENRHILTGPHECSMCVPSKTIATFYCFDCGIKLCVSCSNYHWKLPATKDHGLEDLDNLTAKQLADRQRSTCPHHSGRLVELYCPSHAQLICLMCFPTAHCNCRHVKAVAELAKEKRAALSRQADGLQKTGTTLAQEIQAAKVKFKDMRRAAKDVFDDLEQRVQQRRQEVDSLIQEEERASLTSKVDLERLCVAVTSHAVVAKRMVTSASDDTLLQMLTSLTARLGELEAESRVRCLQPTKDLWLDGSVVSHFATNLSTLGQMAAPAWLPKFTAAQISPSEKLSARKPTGPALACSLKVGDRVKRGKGWKRENEHHVEGLPLCAGTVASIPSRLCRNWKLNPCGRVDVLWDTGRGHYYNMGYQSEYELELA